MSLETGTFVSDLVATNPPGTDKKKQGDDHLRLIKAVLQATFPNASKAFYVPTTAAKSANFSVVAGDMNKIFIIDTSGGALTGTLPALGAGDAGWECSFIKTNTGANAYFIAPPSGTIQSGEAAGLTKARRCIPGQRSKVFWTGSAWIAERVVRHPIGTVLNVPVAALPVGYEWANGQTFGVAADYPEYNTINGSVTVPDLRGRAPFGRDDMGGAAASRITNAGSGIVGTTLGAGGGAQNVALGASDIPPLTTSAVAPTATTTYSTGTVAASGATGSTVISSNTTNTFNASTTVGAHTHSIPNAAQTNVNKMPPALITNFVVVVE